MCMDPTLIAKITQLSSEVYYPNSTSFCFLDSILAATFNLCCWFSQYKNSIKINQNWLLSQPAPWNLTIIDTNILEPIPPYYRKQIQYMTICTKTKKVLLQTLSFTEPRKPALTLTGNFNELSASGFSCMFVSSTSPETIFQKTEHHQVIEDMSMIKKWSIAGARKLCPP